MLIILWYINELPTQQMRPYRTPRGRRGERWQQLRKPAGSRKNKQLGLKTARSRHGFREDIKTVQFGWPLGMPLVRKLEKGLWEVRIQLDNRTARVLFTSHNGLMVLLHGFIKKSQKTPTKDLIVAKQRMATIGGRHE